MDKEINQVHAESQTNMYVLKMKASSSALFSKVAVLLCVFALEATAVSSVDNFLKCLVEYPQSSTSISKAIYTPTNSSFQSVYETYLQNLRFLTPTTPKPVAIVAALEESHVQATVICAKQHGLQIRIRSGGHDFEGLSYISYVPFAILDMFNLRSIDIDIASKTAWVQAGATTGEVYYGIAEKSPVHGFPSGVCTTLGTGGHYSGGGYGTLMRKYGLSIDNIIDAKLVDVKGRILDRKSMGEDLFWAIRGSGGASFGVILSWKIKLVRVPPKVTVFNVTRTLNQNVTDIVFQWQNVVHKLPKDLFIRIRPEVVKGSRGENTVQVLFIGHFLGQTNNLIPLMNERLPKLGLLENDCVEMSWVNSTLFWYGLPAGNISALLDRAPPEKTISKSKSDYVQKPISKEDLEVIWKMMTKIDRFWMQWNPYGGRMDEIKESETPFPHRAGNMFLIHHFVAWTEEGANASNHYINLIREFHSAMAPYVSSRPREAFLNYRDIDIGNNPSNQTIFEAAKVYGTKYFKGNFLRLAYVKAKVDPENFFKNEQSIPPLPSHK